jgi:hypothetical protein
MQQTRVSKDTAPCDNLRMPVSMPLSRTTGSEEESAKGRESRNIEAQLGKMKGEAVYECLNPIHA